MDEKSLAEDSEVGATEVQQGYNQRNQRKAAFKTDVHGGHVGTHL